MRLLGVVILVIVVAVSVIVKIWPAVLYSLVFGLGITGILIWLDRRPGVSKERERKGDRGNG